MSDTRRWWHIDLTEPQVPPPRPITLGDLQAARDILERNDRTDAWRYVMNYGSHETRVASLRGIEIDRIIVDEATTIHDGIYVEEEDK